MLRRFSICGMALSILVAASDACMATGAVAVGQPADITKDGVAIFTHVGAKNAEIAKQKALAGCKDLRDASTTSRALCKIVATFDNQCVAEALDPQDGTPGFGWAMSGNSKTASKEALANCRDTAGPDRQDACTINDNSLVCDGSAR